MLPCFHAVQHALLLLGGKTRKMLQPLPQHLLMLRSQPTKTRIVLQRALLLTRRHVLVAAEPVSRVSLVRVILRVALIRYWMPALRRPVLVLRRLPLVGGGGG